MPETSLLATDSTKILIQKQICASISMRISTRKLACFMCTAACPPINALHTAPHCAATARNGALGWKRLWAGRVAPRRAGPRGWSPPCGGGGNGWGGVCVLRKRRFARVEKGEVRGGLGWMGDVWLLCLRACIRGRFLHCASIYTHTHTRISLHSAGVYDVHSKRWSLLHPRFLSAFSRSQTRYT